MRGRSLKRSFLEVCLSFRRKISVALLFVLLFSCKPEDAEEEGSNTQGGDQVVGLQPQTKILGGETGKAVYRCSNSGSGAHNVLEPAIWKKIQTELRQNNNAGESATLNKLCPGEWKTVTFNYQIPDLTKSEVKACRSGTCPERYLKQASDAAGELKNTFCHNNSVDSGSCKQENVYVHSCEASYCLFSVPLRVKTIDTSGGNRQYRSK